LEITCLKAENQLKFLNNLEGKEDLYGPQERA